MVSSSSNNPVFCLSQRCLFYLMEEDENRAPVCRHAANGCSIFEIKDKTPHVSSPLKF